MSNSLDITDLKQKTYEELGKAIIQAVKDTQSVVIRELPNELHMTRKQFKIMQKDPEMWNVANTQDFLYHTPLNVMEVRVND